jgi:hypothetical protein
VGYLKVVTPVTASPDTRALARFLMAVACCTIALLIGVVALVGVSAPGGPAGGAVVARTSVR